jgi:hypothetical protein
MGHHRGSRFFGGQKYAQLLGSLGRVVDTRRRLAARHDVNQRFGRS